VITEQDCLLGCDNDVVDICQCVGGPNMSAFILDDDDGMILGKLLPDCTVSHASSSLRKWKHIDF
jgi:hypothetical protein